MVPYSISMTIPAEEKMAAYYGDSRFQDKIGNHIFAVGRQLESREVKTAEVFQADEFGVVWDKSVDRDIGIVHKYLVDEKNVETYPFPDPDDYNWYRHIPPLLREHGDCFFEASIGFSLFERAWTLAGMEKILISFVENPAFVETLLDRLTDWLIKAVRKFAVFDGIDAIHFGDDWGQQHGLIMGPVFWRKYLKPRLAKVYGEVKKYNKFVSIHSCGDVQEIFPDLIEIGLDIFNPFQPEVMDVHKMKKLYGEKLTFFGGISLQKTLTFGTPQDVKAEVFDRIEKIGKDGGYIAAPCHAITKDVPAENIDMLIKTLQSQ